MGLVTHLSICAATLLCLPRWPIGVATGRTPLTEIVPEPVELAAFASTSYYTVYNIIVLHHISRAAARLMNHHSLTQSSVQILREHHHLNTA